MKLLALDTSGTACSVAVVTDDEIFSHHEHAPMQQMQLVLPMVTRTLQEASLTLSDLDAFAFGCGPGSFTGIRIAASMIQGLSLGVTKPVIPISSLAGAAQSAFELHGWKNILVAMDARMGEVYFAAYIIQDNLAVLQGEEKLLKPDVLPELPGEWYGVGTGWVEYEMNITPTEIDSTLMPNATAIAHLAQPKYNTGEWVEPEEAFPVYLRNEIAKKK